MKMVNNLGKLGNCFELCSSISLQVCNKKEYKEVEETIFLARSILSNFMNKSPNDFGFTFLLTQIEDTLEKLSIVFEGKKSSTVEGKENYKMQIFDLDYLLKQQMEQINFEYVHSEGICSISHIEDIFAKKFWVEKFGNECIVEKSKFMEQFTIGLNVELNQDELEQLEYYLDFTEDGYISVFEFQKFLTNFGSFKKVGSIIKDLVKRDILVFKISSKRANSLLENKKTGNYLFRFSKSQFNSFAITYIDQKKAVKNSLILNTKDGIKTTSSSTLYSSLASFLHVHRSVLKNHEVISLSLVKSFSTFFCDEKINPLTSDPSDKNSTTYSHFDNLPSLSSNQEENEFDSQISSVCISCGKSERDSVMDCKHFICCYNCSKNMKSCPICKTPNNNPLQIFVC